MKRNEKFLEAKQSEMWCIDFALVGSEKFKTKRSEMKRKKLFYSGERAKRMRNGYRFALKRKDF